MRWGNRLEGDLPGKGLETGLALGLDTNPHPLPSWPLGVAHLELQSRMLGVAPAILQA